MYSFKEKRALIWGGAGFTAGIMFFNSGQDHTYTPMQNLGMAILWGLGSALVSSTIFWLLNKIK